MKHLFFLDGLKNLLRRGHLRILADCCVANPRRSPAAAVVCARQAIQNRSAHFPQQVFQAILSFLLLCGAAQAAGAGGDGLELLERFLHTARAGSAEFTQTVTGAGLDGGDKVSHGRFAFQRPGRFKFVYTSPFAQTIVADGQKVWLHDVDLNQVTVHDQARALGSTPAAWIATGEDLAALRRDFDLESQAQGAPDADGLRWVQATPKKTGTKTGENTATGVAEEGSIASVRMGFGAQGELGALEVLDHFGQKSRIRFRSMQLQAALPPETFRFTPPDGADVLQP